MATVTKNLRLRSSDGRSRPVPLAGDVVSIGRHPSNTMPIADERASRQHCAIEPDGVGGWVLRDLGSRNGTRLNGQRVSEAVLSVGDVIAIGKLELFVEPGVVARSSGPIDSAAPTAEHERAQTRMRRVQPATSAGDDITDLGDDLHRVLQGLPPRDQAPPDVQIVQADGKTSGALDAVGAGPEATKLLLQIASKSRATDIHMEPKPEMAQIRMRVDGQMVWVADVQRAVGDRVAGLIKTACQMKAAGSDAVLDGHFSARFAGHDSRRVEYRVSFTPSMHGQKLVVRVLDQSGVPTSLSEMGLTTWMEDKVRQVCERDAGLLLTVGPTGSGKTTTLYNALRAVDRERRNVVTIEDPVEYQLEGVTQIPVNEQRGNNFDGLLRSVLRQDPDVILVGEIRDEPTARTAMQAAMTGHVVFSTLHAKDSMSSVFRLLDLGVEPYLVANALQLVLAQRLVRVLCERCSREEPVKPGQATRIGKYLQGKSSVFAPVGCTACLKTGYRGRHAIFELLEVTDELRDVILSNPTMGDMRKIIQQGHFDTLAQSGWKLAAGGVTSLDEVERVATSG
ncbi:MAG: ATPase, T2SS/T4P/T4SS family [Planctomycetota bacterium]